jgi:hypothetical protein
MPKRPRQTLKILPDMPPKKASQGFCPGTNNALNRQAFPESTDTLNDVSAVYNLLQGRLTVFAGFGKGSGKTAFFSSALHEARKTGSVGIFTIGLEGAGGKRQAIDAMPGDVLITTAALARAANASLEIIDALPGRSALGQLCLCRAVRGGSAALAGPEHFSQLASAIGFASKNRLVASCLVDGAAGRITQAGALPGAQLLYCAMADSANYRSVAEKIKMIASLADLPQDCGWQSENSLQIEGPLTTSIAEAIPEGIRRISIETFTDCFLDAQAFYRALQRFEITVRRQVPLMGFVVGLKNIKREIILEAVPTAASKIAFSPFELWGDEWVMNDG